MNRAIAAEIIGNPHPDFQDVPLSLILEQTRGIGSAGTSRILYDAQLSDPDVHLKRLKVRQRLAICRVLCPKSTEYGAA